MLLKRILFIILLGFSALPFPSNAVVTKAYPEVVLLNSDVSFDSSSDGAGRCTGTFIRPTVILTAAHCVQRFYDGKLGGKVFHTQDGQGRTLQNLKAVPDQVRVSVGGAVIHPTRVHVSRHAIPVMRADLSLDFVEQDLALLEVETPVKLTRRVGKRTPSRGDAVFMVGFGTHGDKGHPKHEGRNFMNWIEPESRTLVIEGAVSACDNPPRDGKDWAVCGGDSGGPLIDAVTGEVLGVASMSVIPPEGKRRLSVYIDLNTPEAREFLESVQ